MKNAAALEYIVNGNKLEKTEGISDELYELLTE